jgi:hypothetical protein
MFSGSNGLPDNNGGPFSTYDSDRLITGRHNNIKFRSGWWYKENYNSKSNLNGEYVTPGKRRYIDSSTSAGMIYTSFRIRESLKMSRMMFRRV